MSSYDPAYLWFNLQTPEESVLNHTGESPVQGWSFNLLVILRAVVPGTIGLLMFLNWIPKGWVGEEGRKRPICNNRWQDGGNVAVIQRMGSGADNLGWNPVPVTSKLSQIIWRLLCLYFLICEMRIMMYDPWELNYLIEVKLFLEYTKCFKYTK